MTSENKDVRWKQRLQNFEKAFLLLERTLEIEYPSEAERGGLIQFYEMAFDLSWKLMKDYLEEQGLTVNSPREAIEQAFQSGVIKEGQPWLDALEGRNLTTHTYDQATAEKIVSEIRAVYFPMIQQLYLRLRAEASG